MGRAPRTRPLRGRAGAPSIRRGRAREPPSPNFARFKHKPLIWFAVQGASLSTRWA
jgi:hypothetical protein